jgi:hypothetical protein
LRWIKLALVHDFRSGSAIGSIGTWQTGDAPPTAIPNAAIALVIMVSTRTEPQGWRPIVRRKKRRAGRYSPANVAAPFIDHSSEM